MKLDSSHVIESMLLKGIDVNVCFDGQSTFLHEAAFHNAFEIVKVRFESH